MFVKCAIKFVVKRSKQELTNEQEQQKHHQYTMSKDTALSQWEIENNINQSDRIYKYDAEKQSQILSTRPWKDEYVLESLSSSFTNQSL
jgi:hypothetical protein